MITDEKYRRSVNLLCPTCGSSHFEVEAGTDEATEVTKCAACGRLTTKDELMRENSENIQEHISEMAEEVKKDLARELKERLKQALSGSKCMRIT